MAEETSPDLIPATTATDQDDQDNNDRFQYVTPLVDEAERSETTHARYNPDVGAWECKHCGRSRQGWTPNAVYGHLGTERRGCPNYPPQSLLKHLRLLTTDDITAYLTDKWNDPEERLATIVGFTAATESWPTLQTASADLWALSLSIFAVIVFALASQSRYLTTRPALREAVRTERNRARTRFGLDPEQLTVQGGVGLALGLGVVAVDDYFHLGLLDGGVIDQVVQVARLLVGGI